MLPIRDHNPSHLTPHVTRALIAVNVAVFVWSHLILQGYARDLFEFTWAMIPLRLHFGVSLYTPVTAMFLHGGWLHIAGNMLFLWIFGDNVEARLGHRRYLAFYLTCGVIAALAEYLHDPLARYPVIGASGAIAGVLGAYLRLYPRARIDVFFFFLIFWKTFAIPAWIVLGVWIGLQIFDGVLSPGTGDGIAYWEHIGGFGAGFALALLLRGPRLATSPLPRVPRR